MRQIKTTVIVVVLLALCGVAQARPVGIPTLYGPENVPGLSIYTYSLSIPLGSPAPTNISWSVDKTTATISGSTTGVNCNIAFKNTMPDIVTITCHFTSGTAKTVTLAVAIVKVTLGNPTFATPGLPATSSSMGEFLVNAGATYVTVHDPGSDYAAFTSTATKQAVEPAELVGTNAGGGGSAFSVTTSVTLTPPTARPSAIAQIEVGYIQKAELSGSATYNFTNGLRTVNVPTNNSVDWLASPNAQGPTDKWPWYDANSMWAPTGTGSQNNNISLEDSPSQRFPAQWNPNKTGDPNATKSLVSSSAPYQFNMYMGARTKDSYNSANKYYFSEGWTDWKANFVWPFVAGTSIITTNGNWNTPLSATSLSVNVVPSAKNGNSPFRKWIPSP